MIRTIDLKHTFKEAYPKCERHQSKLNLFSADCNYFIITEKSIIDIVNGSGFIEYNYAQFKDYLNIPKVIYYDK